MAQPDVVVVGGGVIGLAVAWSLATHDRRVLLLERNQLGGGTSGVGGGFVCQVSQEVSPMLGLVRESIQRYYRLAERLGADIGLRSCGSLVLAADGEEALAIESHAGTLAAAGVSCEMLEADDARREEPALAEAVTAAVRCADDIQIDPGRLIAAYVDGLSRVDAELRCDRLVVGLQRSGKRVIGVRTQYGDIDCDQVVLTTGCWTPALLAPTHAGYLRPRRGQLWHSRPRRRFVHHLVLGADYLAAKFRSAAHGLSLEQTVDGVVRLGGSREWLGFDSRPTALLEEIRVNAERYLRFPDDLVWSHAVAGLRPGTADGLPLIGNVGPGLWIAAGHEGSGFATAPATAARLVRQMSGRAADLRPFHPGRFMTPEGEPVGGATSDSD